MIQRLELADFRISPSQRLQMLKVLDSFGTDYLRQVSGIKFLLAPLIVKSGEEQQRFYEIYDQYFEGIQKEEAALIASPPNWREKVPKYWWRAIGWLAGLLVLFAVWKIVQGLQPPPTEISYSLLHQPQVRLKDTLHLKIPPDRVDTANVNYHWQIFGRGERTNPEYEIKGRPSWSLPILKVGNSFLKDVVLVETDRRDGSVDTIRSSFTILCEDPVPVEQILVPDNVSRNTDFEVDFEGGDTTGLRFEWDLGDGSRQRQSSFQHRYASEGIYLIRLKVNRINVAGFCEREFSRQISVGRQRALLQAKTLYKDKVEPFILFSTGTWILLALLGMYLWYHWLKWFTGPRSKKRAAGEQDLDQRFSYADRAPYFIPWQNQSSFIRVDPSFYRLADILRQRQEGLRKEINIPATIRSTVEKGGFPVVEFSKRDVPSEYLFLVDEQAPGSHQARLFEYLIRFLQDKDVQLNWFWYNTSFNRFWNAEYPQGLNLDQLRREYPHRRLVLLGDAHGLIDPFAKDRPALIRMFAEIIEMWKYRLLLTPVPVASWNYREGTLYEYFPIFPCDLEGFKLAMSHLEQASGEGEDYRPDFKTWKTQLGLKQKDPDINYRDWNQPEAYPAYLRDHPALLKWLQALAVYPKPNWNLTIAIGRALEHEGVQLTYDNLLILSQVPWLKNKPLSPRLRKALLSELDPQAEQLARQAIIRELEQVAPHLQNTHANLEIQSGLAIQKFHRDPTDHGHQEAIQFLIRQGLIGKKEKAELNRRVETMPVAEKGRATTTIDEFLEKQLAGDPAEKPRRPLNRHFFLALGATIWFLAIYFMTYTLNGSPWLYKLVFQKEPVPFVEGENTTLKDYFFVKEEIYVDSAVVYNNEGVDLWNQLEDGSRGFTEDQMLVRAKQRFQQAVNYRTGPYELAQLNGLKMAFNSGLVHYHRHLENFTRPAELSLAHADFRAATEGQSDSVFLDALHGIGLVYYYQDSVDLARRYRDSLLTLSDSLYFLGLAATPNLLTLLPLANELPEQIIPVRDNNCYRTDVVGSTLAFRNRPLSQKEMEALNQDRNSRTSLSLDRATLLRTLSHETRVRKLGESDNQYYIEAGRERGYIAKYYRGRPTLALCPPPAPDRASNTAVFVGRVLSENSRQGIGGANVTLRLLNLDILVGGTSDRTGRYILTASSKEIIDREIQVIAQYQGRSERQRFSFPVEDRLPDTVRVRDFLFKEELPPDEASPAPLTDSRDGNSYRTIRVGEQIWMAENLNYAGREVAAQSWCYLELEAFCQQAGRLYTFEAARMACPAGWRLPDPGDWALLLKNLGSAGGNRTPVAENNGFAATLGGSRQSDGTFVEIGQTGNFWTSLIDRVGSANYYRLMGRTGELSLERGNPSDAFSCRCVKNPASSSN